MKKCYYYEGFVIGTDQIVCCWSSHDYSLGKIYHNHEHGEPLVVVYIRKEVYPDGFSWSPASCEEIEGGMPNA